MTFVENITSDTPVNLMTAGQLKAFMFGEGSNPTAGRPAGGASDAGKRYVYGIHGIMQLFHVSNVTAQRYKRGILAPAIRQEGRKIIVDVDKAEALFGKSRDSKQK